MRSAGEGVDVHLQDNAGLAFDERLRSSTNRSAWPARSGLEARSLIGGPFLEIHLVRRGAA